MTPQNDTTNFFDDLEHQLVAATTDRPRRLRRARNRTIATMCTILVAVLAVGGGLAAALSNTTGDSGGGAPAGHAPPPAQRTVTLDPRTGTAVRSCGRTVQGGATGGVDRGSLEVAVLNGTTVPGLARGVANRLQNTRFKIGTVTNAATQDRSATQVYYARPACIAAATQVAEAIGLTGDRLTLSPMPSGVRVIAGENANVAVVVGSDQNTRP